MNATVIGGAGLLGSAVTAEFARCALFASITMIDAQGALVDAEVQDLREAFIDAPVAIHSATQINSASQSEIIILAGGFAPQSNESRVALARRYLKPFCQQLDALKRAGLRRDAKVIIAAEPSELLTAIAAIYLDLPASQIIGLGTMTDARRLRLGLADQLKAAPASVSMSAIGVRGKDLVPLWSTAQHNGEPIARLRPWEGNWRHDVEAAVRSADTDMIQRKGGAWRTPAAAVSELAQAIVRDERKVLPVCVSHDFRVPKYGLRKATLALPSTISRQGAGEVHELKLWPKEESALKQAARHTNRDLTELASGR